MNPSFRTTAMPSLQSFQKPLSPFRVPQIPCLWKQTCYFIKKSLIYSFPTALVGSVVLRIVQRGKINGVTCHVNIYKSMHMSLVEQSQLNYIVEQMCELCITYNKLDFYILCIQFISLFWSLKRFKIVTSSRFKPLWIYSTVEHKRIISFIYNDSKWGLNDKKSP